MDNTEALEELRDLRKRAARVAVDLKRAKRGAWTLVERSLGHSGFGAASAQIHAHLACAESWLSVIEERIAAATKELGRATP